jgi:hypothetical protein
VCRRLWADSPCPSSLARVKLRSIARPDGATLVSALLDEDGSFGLGTQANEPASLSGADSGAVSR